ncbi:MAG TPA: DUF1573 domain-containing protein [Saprospiraceae bacterium]|nr:DUF1573 domain-containing protein [Saprospiraceae bacterium]
MKIRNFFFFLTVISALTFYSCANEGGKADENASEDTATEQMAEDAMAEAQPVAEAEQAMGPSTTVEFEESEWDFGKITDGDKVQHNFQFTNTGSEPLTIKNAKGSCGCTVPEWPREPIAPGESGEIKVEFNSKKKPGKQTKRVTITANTEPPQSYLTIKADVQPNPDAEAATK